MCDPYYPEPQCSSHGDCVPMSVIANTNTNSGSGNGSSPANTSLMYQCACYSGYSSRTDFLYNSNDCAINLLAARILWAIMSACMATALAMSAIKVIANCHALVKQSAHDHQHTHASFQGAHGGHGGIGHHHGDTRLRIWLRLSWHEHALRITFPILLTTCLLTTMCILHVIDPEEYAIGYHFGATALVAFGIIPGWWSRAYSLYVWVRTTLNLKQLTAHQEMHHHIVNNVAKARAVLIWVVIFMQ
jgi:hypothetical protein